MKRHPEYMILIALASVMVAGIIASAASCAIIAPAANYWSEHHPRLGSDWPITEIGQGGNGGIDIGDIGGIGNGGYTEADVPDSMEIETDELQSDLEAVINNDITAKLGLSDDSKVTVTNLKKDKTTKPELKNGHVLSTATGTATITNADGKSDTVEYTSYYYAKDPTAKNITWYIYGYDLGSYDILPPGFKDVAGDPMNIRDILQGNFSELTSRLGVDTGEGTKTA